MAAVEVWFCEWCDEFGWGHDRDEWLDLEIHPCGTPISLFVAVTEEKD